MSDIHLMLPISEERDEYVLMELGRIASPDGDEKALHLIVVDGDECETSEGEIWIPIAALDSLIEGLEEFRDELANA